MSEDVIAAGLVVIGDEILSGRTKDANIGAIADFLTDLGLELREVRVVEDRTEAIVAAVNALRSVYGEVFTTGGIGPTHDDVTAEAMAIAFDVPLGENPEAVKMLSARYGQEALTEARRRMARIPEGGELIANPVTGAPGFTIGNVHVLAGIPKIMKAMLVDLAPRLASGRKLHLRTIPVPAGEGAYADQLAEIQLSFPNVAIGSYPKIAADRFLGEIVLRSRDVTRLEEAVRAVESMLADLLPGFTQDTSATKAP